MNNISAQEYYVVSSSSSSFQTYVPVDISRQYTHVAVTSACIPKTYYVLPNPAVLQITQNGGLSYNVTFAAGNYSTISFAPLFVSNVAAAGVSPCSYTISLPDSLTKVQTSKFTFAVTGNTVQPQFLIQDYFLARIMGFLPNVPYTFVGNSLLSANVINFQSYDELLIKSNMVSNKANLLQEIFSSQNLYNSSINWTNPSIQMNAKILVPNSTNFYSFSLVDEQNNQINLNGSEWSIVLCFFKISNFEEVVKRYIELASLQHLESKIDQ